MKNKKKEKNLLLIIIINYYIKNFTFKKFKNLNTIKYYRSKEMTEVKQISV